MSGDLGVGFTAEANRLATERDSVFLYQIFLGRNPESAAAIESNYQHSIANILMYMVRSAEFLDNVVPGVFRTRPLPQASFGAQPSNEHIQWLNEIIHTPDGQVQPGVNWPDLLVPFVPPDAAPDHPEAGRRGRVEDHVPLTSRGLFELCTPAEITGWCGFDGDRRQPRSFLLVIEGVFCMKVDCDVERADAIALLPTLDVWGFNASLPALVFERSVIEVVGLDLDRREEIVGLRKTMPIASRVTQDFTRRVAELADQLSQTAQQLLKLSP